MSGIRAFKRAGCRHVGMDDDARDLIQREWAGKSFYGYVAKTLKAEMRFKNLIGIGIPFQNVAGKLLGRAQIFGIKIPLLVQNLCVTQADGCACWSADTHLHPTYHILAKIEDGLAFGRV